MAFQIILQYLQSAEFSSPSAPACFFQKDLKVGVNVKMDIQVQKTDDKTFIVSLVGEFLNQSEGEPKQDIFKIKIVMNAIVSMEAQLDESLRRHHLLVDVPGLILPAVRQELMNLSAAGGFPPFVLAPVDFEALLKQNDLDASTPSARPVH